MFNNKKKIIKTASKLLAILLLAGMLVACNAPGTLPATNAPVVPPPQPTYTSLPPTLVSATSTNIPAAGPAVTLNAIHMQTSLLGWGWSINPENKTRLLRTSDGGQTWMDVSPEAESLVGYGSFFLGERNAWVTFYNATANNSGGLLHTTDAGQTWQKLPANDIFQNINISFSSDTDGVAQTAGLGAGNVYFNYYQTHDSGQTWAPIEINPPKPEPGLPVGTVHLCSICGDQMYYDTKRILVAYGDMASTPVGNIRLALSNDLGQSWQNLNLPMPAAKYANGSVAPGQAFFLEDTGVLPINIIEYNADNSLAYSILVMYTTQDGGQTWSAAPGILESQTMHFENVLILSAQDAFVRCGHDLCNSKDGAQTWQTLTGALNFDSSSSMPDYVSFFTFIDPQNGWAISGEGLAANLWRTSDGGVTWSKLAPSLVQ